MNCCSRPMWDIWSDEDRAVVAFGCRYCGAVNAAPSYMHLITWARTTWGDMLRDGLSPRGATMKVKYPPPASRFIKVEPHCIHQEGVPKGQKRCAMCKLVRRLGEFYPSVIDSSGKTRTVDGYMVYCIECYDRTRKAHEKGMLGLDKVADAILPIAERDDKIRLFASGRDRLVKAKHRERNHRKPKNQPGTFFCTKCRYQLPIKAFKEVPEEKRMYGSRSRVNEHKGVYYQLMCATCIERGRRNKAAAAARKKELGL